jgi:hypothetical protein
MDCCIDHRENAGHILTDVVIPKSQDTITFRGKIRSPPLVSGVIGMLPAVDLYDNSKPMTCEIGEVGTNRGLAPKVMLLEGRLPQMLPKLLFGFGRVTTQRAGPRHAVVDWTLRSLWHLAPPTPDPSPPSAFAQGLRRTEGGEQVRAHRKIRVCGHIQFQNRFLTKHFHPTPLAQAWASDPPPQGEGKITLTRLLRCGPRLRRRPSPTRGRA